jgi:hypothetical protein
VSTKGYVDQNKSLLGSNLSSRAPRPSEVLKAFLAPHGAKSSPLEPKTTLACQVTHKAARGGPQASVGVILVSATNFVTTSGMINTCEIPPHRPTRLAPSSYTLPLMP